KANSAKQSSTAIGDQAQAMAENSIAMGTKTLALGENATSIGATGDPITTLSLTNDGTNLTSINGIPVDATGTPLDSAGNYDPNNGTITSIAGVPMSDQQDVEDFLTRLMSGANMAAGKNSVSVGVGTFASGDSSIAMGDGVLAGSSAVGIGKNVIASGNSVGIGSNASAATDSSFAGGHGALVPGAADNGVAIRASAEAAHGQIADPGNPSQTIDAAGMGAVAIGNKAHGQ